MTTFESKLNGQRLTKRTIEILQLNLGKLCNLACVHCHVEAGPQKQRENMDHRTALACIKLMDTPGLTTVDLTGGAPEMNPNFRMLVRSARARGLDVIDRCNLTIGLEPAHADLFEFLKNQRVQIVASLPCYSIENVDKQRGKGTFDGSLEALLKLNALGYGHRDSDLELHLVYNPVGPHLPPAQAELEASYRERLKKDFGIVFNRLYTITNMPITRFAKYLKAFGQLDAYLALLENQFNLGTLEHLMCQNTLSVSWDGQLYDCDFNQALGLTIQSDKLSVFDLDIASLKHHAIRTAKHCFGCTAGAGSSCQGALETAATV